MVVHAGMKPFAAVSVVLLLMNSTRKPGIKKKGPQQLDK
jgi:hypothetical protein